MNREGLAEPSSGARDPGFASFWHGPLTPFAYGCLATFARAGVPLAVYSYNESLDLPPGVRLQDARAICPDPSAVDRYLVNGKRSIATFADMFRYRLIRKTGCCWVDADILCLAQPNFGGDEYVFGRQADAVSETLVNNAVLRLPRRHPALAELVATAEAAVGVDQSWGALGPFLLTPVLTRFGLYDRAREPREFYPVEPERVWTLFLPDERERVEEAAQGATFLHLWSEAIKWRGWDPQVCPPVGSYLHGAFDRCGALERFSRISREDEVLGLAER